MLVGAFTMDVCSDLNRETVKKLLSANAADLKIVFKKIESNIRERLWGDFTPNPEAEMVAAFEQRLDHHTGINNIRTEVKPRRWIWLGHIHRVNKS